MDNIMGLPQCKLYPTSSLVYINFHSVKDNDFAFRYNCRKDNLRILCGHDINKPLGYPDHIPILSDDKPNKA